MYSNLSFYNFTINYIPIPIVWLIIYGITSSYTFYIYNNEQALSSIPILKKIISILFYFCSFMTMLCHTISIYKDPGIIDYNKMDILKNNQKELCKKCNKYRPLRAHHCSTCGRCIMKMDHHCPWIFNCVGYGNQKIFFLFLFYSSFGCLIAFLCLITRFFSDEFSYMLRHPKYKINFNSGVLIIIIQTLISLNDPLMLLMGTLLSFSMTIAIGGLFFTQIYLISRNVTGVEDTIYSNNPEMNEWYAKKDRWFMFKTVLGLNQRWKWFLPIVESNKYNSGYSFDTPYQRIKNKKTIKEENDTCCKKCGRIFCCCC